MTTAAYGAPLQPQSVASNNSNNNGNFFGPTGFSSGPTPVTNTAPNYSPFGPTPTNNNFGFPPNNAQQNTGFGFPPNNANTGFGYPPQNNNQGFNNNTGFPNNAFGNII
jgi:hypothetical protein